MEKRKNKNKNMSQYLIIGSFFLYIGLGVIGLKLYNNYFTHIKEENAIEDFFEIKQEDTKNVIVDEVQETKEEPKKESTYNSNISYFKNLNKMELNDLIYVYYNGEKFNYKITNIYDVEKTGQVSISKNNNANTLTLITCRHNTNKQIVIIAELTNREVY